MSRKKISLLKQMIKRKKKRMVTLHTSYCDKSHISCHVLGKALMGGQREPSKSIICPVR